MTAPSPARDRALFGAAVLLLFGFFLLLLVLGHRGPLRAALSRRPPLVSEGARSASVRASLRALGRTPGGALLDQLPLPVLPAGAALARRTACRLLLAFRADRVLAAAFAAHARIRLGGSELAGFDRAAPALFGVSPSVLTEGEVALLCAAALDTSFTPGASVSATFARRRRLLDRLHRRGALSRPELRAELARPLALAPDHRPIW